MSALAYITADEIKVDRSFVTAMHQRPRSQSVLKAIESIADALGMTVVAEGIESFEELAYLQATTQIQFAQGYYFAPPFLLEDFAHARGLTRERRTPSLTNEPTATRRLPFSRAGR